MSGTPWPALPYDDWKDTYATLHMWLQVVGKVALAQAPSINHSWGIAFQVTSRGLSTYLLPHGDVAAMSAAMQRLADDPALVHRLGTQARRFAESFTWERAAAETEHHLLQSMHGGTR